MVCMRVAFQENDGNHGNDENNKDNSDSYNQGTECWIRGNHHANDTCARTPCTPIQGSTRVVFLKSPSEPPCRQLNSFSFVQRGRSWGPAENDNTKVTLGLARLVIFFFPYNPPHPIPRQTPRPSHPEKLDFGPFRLCSAPFGVCFGSVSGPFRGVGWGRGEGLL